MLDTTIQIKTDNFDGFGVVAPLFKRMKWRSITLT